MEGAGRFQLIYDKQRWMVDQESSRVMAGMLESTMIYNNETKDICKEHGVNEWFSYYETRVAELKGKELWLKGDGCEVILHDLSIIMEISCIKDGSKKEFILIDSGKLAMRAQNKESIIESFLDKRKCVCNSCHCEVDTVRLKEADYWINNKPHPFMRYPKRWQLDYLLEKCPRCGRVAERIDKEDGQLSLAETEALSKISKNAPVPVQTLYGYGERCFIERNFCKALTLFLYAYDYYTSWSIERDITIRRALEISVDEYIKEAHLLKLDLLRRIGRTPFREYDVFDFAQEDQYEYNLNGTMREIEAKYILSLAREENTQKVSYNGLERFFPDINASTFEVYVDDIPPKTGEKTITVDPKQLDIGEEARVGDFVVLTSEEYELICRIRKIKEEVSFDIIEKRLAGQQLLGDTLLILEIVEEKKLKN